MSVLLEEIRRIDQEAASVLEKAGFRTDSDIQSLTREDLCDLFPRPQAFHRRKAISDIIHRQKPINVLLEEMKDFIPHESLRAALTGNGVLVNYLRILKDMKAQMDNVQTFLDAQINLLEDIGKTEPNQELQKGSSTGKSSAAVHGPMKPDDIQTHDHQQEGHGSKSAISAPCSQGKTYYQTDPQGKSGTLVQLESSGEKVPQNSPTGNFLSRRSQHSEEFLTVKYWMVVSGKTFDAHLQLMDKIKDQLQGYKLQPVECSQDSQIIFVFCPIVSRLATDVNAAMTDVKDFTGDTPVILVLMHHTYRATSVTPLRTWSEDKNVLLHVNVFYHEKIPGLLKCQENTEAVSQIQNEFLRIHPRKYTSADTQDEGSTTGSLTGGDDNGSSCTDRDNNSGSKNEPKRSRFSMFSWQ